MMLTNTHPVILRGHPWLGLRVRAGELHGEARHVIVGRGWSVRAGVVCDGDPSTVHVRDLGEIEVIEDESDY